MACENCAGTARTIALIGNPNVGKSTVFNSLTGMKQHTGNWPGKTVAVASGTFKYMDTEHRLVDLPGTYSLQAHSAEEEVARDYICFGGADAAAVVCDATCLERNMILVLQVLEITGKVVVCVNLMDEAKRKGIQLDLDLISSRLGVPVVGITARKNHGADSLAPHMLCAAGHTDVPRKISYPAYLENALSVLTDALGDVHLHGLPPRWLALKLLEDGDRFLQSVKDNTGTDLAAEPSIVSALDKARALLQADAETPGRLRDDIVSTVVNEASAVCEEAVISTCTAPADRDRRIDRIVTSRAAGFPIMFGLLLLIFWLTMVGSNYPSSVLSAAFSQLGVWLRSVFEGLGAPSLLTGMLLDGIYTVVSWVVAVMLPPMAIFFPLFTLLEDLGYLPRIAFNLDRCFQRCSACGKQALTMCMGFGCNAVGVSGCRIIDSPRERLIAVITNSFVPCNGRFPLLIAMVSMFLARGSAVSALLLSAVIVLGVAATLGASSLLSRTVLRGVPSSFTLELPPYRPPQIGRVIVRSVLDRTLFVLGRAVTVAAPAGLIIWAAANISVSGASLLDICSGALDPIGRLMGLDGVILLAFILAFPANELVIPIMLMAYLSRTSLTDYESLDTLRILLVDNGWTWRTAVCTIIFSLMHWPCSTTLITIYKETHSAKWTALSFVLPTVSGFICCVLFSTICRLFGAV